MTLGFDKAARTRTHALLPQCLLASDVEPIILVGRMLNALQAVRIVADYRLNANEFASFQRIRHHIESANQLSQSLYGVSETERLDAHANIAAYLSRLGL